MTNTQPDKGTKPTARNEAPDKGGGKARKAASAFRTISEVADDLGVQQHVLRFWETKFTQVKPLKRGGGRRYYRPEDVILLKKIHHLLYTEGYTIKGVQKLLKGQGKQQIVAGDINAAADNAIATATQMVASTAAQTAAATAPKTTPIREGAKLSDRQRVILESMLGELKDLRSMVKGK
jgi:DNA-binding transcriptional MerR regulator